MKEVMHCPGQDSRYWTPEDIFETKCPHCAKLVEFFKDDRKRTCPHCKKICLNPKLNLGCLEWCEHADKCQDLLGGQEGGEDGGPKES
jgi:hypothetical protein